MKKIATIWMFVLFGICSGLASIVSAEPSKGEGQKWVEITPVLVNDETGEVFSTSLAEQNKVDTPKVWFGFGQWGDNEKYQVSFFAEEVNQEYTIYFGVYNPVAEGWGFVSQINPQFTTALFNSGGFEAVDRKEAQGGTYISRPGVYPLEVRIYINGTSWYFSYQETINVPTFEVWLSDVCQGSDGQVTLKFEVHSFPGITPEGGLIRVSFPVYDVFLDIPLQKGEWGLETSFNVGEGVYAEYLSGQTIGMEYLALVGGQVVSYLAEQYYYWGPQVCGP